MKKAKALMLSGGLAASIAAAGSAQAPQLAGPAAAQLQGAAAAGVGAGDFMDGKAPAGARVPTDFSTGFTPQATPANPGALGRPALRVASRANDPIRSNRGKDGAAPAGTPFWMRVAVAAAILAVCLTLLGGVGALIGLAAGSVKAGAIVGGALGFITFAVSESSVLEEK